MDASTYFDDYSLTTPEPMELSMVSCFDSSIDLTKELNLLDYFENEPQLAAPITDSSDDVQLQLADIEEFLAKQQQLQ